MSITATAQKSVLDEIVAHIRSQGGSVSSWYAGITENIEDRLFGAHRVPRKNHWFIYRDAGSEAQARSIEKALLDWGCDGGPGGGDRDATIVYAYLKTPSTNP